MSVGMPAYARLLRFGEMVQDVFGEAPYWVGSSLDSKEWRDVDVRLMLPDEEYERLFGPSSTGCVNPRVNVLTQAFAALGREVTGLPIDFQFQAQTEANKQYDGHRSALIQIRGGNDCLGLGLGAPRPVEGEWSERDTKASPRRFVP